MFHLVKGIYRNWQLKEQYSILLLGLDNAGKTTFLETLKKEYNLQSKPLDRILPTVGQNIGFIPIDDSCILKIWDVGGQESLRSMWKEYYSQAHGIIFVIDSSDKSRLQECCNSLLQIINDDSIDDGMPILMLANKQDKQIKMEIFEIKMVFNKLAEHLDALDSRVLPISALTGEGMKSSVEWLLIRLKRNKSNKPPDYR